ncbi:hypothetical protein D3C72_945350 [compost metagenome]
MHLRLLLHLRLMEHLHVRVLWRHLLLLLHYPWQLRLTTSIHLGHHLLLNDLTILVDHLVLWILLLEHLWLLTIGWDLRHLWLSTTHQISYGLLRLLVLWSRSGCWSLVLRNNWLLVEAELASDLRHCCLQSWSNHLLLRLLALLLWLRSYLSFCINFISTTIITIQRWDLIIDARELVDPFQWEQFDWFQRQCQRTSETVDGLVHASCDLVIRLQERGEEWSYTTDSTSGILFRAITEWNDQTQQPRDHFTLLRWNLNAEDHVLISIIVQFIQDWETDHSNPVHFLTLECTSAFQINCYQLILFVCSWDQLV